MKKLNKMLLAMMVMSLASTAAFAICPVKDGCKDKAVETYAHPTLFGTASEYATANNTYSMGGTIKKVKNRISFDNKENVFVHGWANNVLQLIKENSKSTQFNPKLPVLRSELAVILAEGFAPNATTASDKTFTDVADNYWAKDWIYKALNSGLMIGYPSGQFIPDQPVTKAEVFATIAQIISVPFTSADYAPEYNGATMKYVPTWAYNATREVVESNLLKNVPAQDKIVNDEYLSKEQVAYLVALARQDVAYLKTLGVDPNAPTCVKNYQPILLNIKMNDRISAKHSNIGDTFTSNTTTDVEINGVTYPAGSKVYGKVVKVQRPGLDNDGMVQVKFVKIKNGDNEVLFPEKISEAKAETLKNPNILARIVGMPLSMAGRITGVAGRGVGSIVSVTGNRLEELGDDLSNVFVETLTLNAGAGVKSLGAGVWTIGEGLFDYTKVIASGVFGLLYEVGDELVYVVAPSLSNDSALNPNEELTVLF